MQKLFISYAEEDENKVIELTKSIKRRNNSSWAFQKSLKKGPNFQKQIDEALGTSDYVLCMITKNYFESTASLEEAYAMFPQEEKLLMLYFEDIPLTTKKQRPLLTSKWGIKFYPDYEKGLKELIKTIGGISNNIETYTKSQNRSQVNPFCKERADFVDPDFISKFFYEPEKEKYDRLTGQQSVIMEGGRGSGKTMILRSLEIIPAIERTTKRTFKESHLNYFGIYIRVHRGGFALSNDTELKMMTEQVAKYLFIDDMNLQFTEALIDNLSECSNTGRLSITKNLEERICKEIVSILKSGVINQPNNFRSLKMWINDMKADIRQFIVKKALEFNPQYNGCASGIDTFRKICISIRSVLDELKNVTFFLLIDEYENFLLFQQKIVNTFIKLADNVLGIKVASKFEGIYTRQTILGQELQRNHDYHLVRLDYDLTNANKLSLYRQLVIGVSQKYLENVGFETTDITKLLKKGTDSRISEESLRAELSKMLSNKVRKKKYSKEKFKYLLSYYRTTLIFRVLISKRWKKDYSGFNNFLFLSSGIIRFFLDLCGMAIIIASQKNLDVKKIKEIPAEIQTESAHSVSHALLEKLALGVEDHGIAMQKFIMDIGDIFRTKLQYDNNEPETIRISIADSESKWPTQLKTVLSTGVRESVFQHIEDSTGIIPKNPTTHRPTTYLLNRMYAPGLGISHTARWRTLFKADELNSILSDDDTSKTKVRMIAKIKKSNNDDDTSKTKVRKIAKTKKSNKNSDNLMKSKKSKTLDEWS